MERKKSLPPGFRFHPTDLELVMYYLKRKVTGRKLRAEAIADVNIYQFSPWDLPDMSALKSKDLEWFFFCPMEKRYARGVRVKRATEKGFWKTTGKDRNVNYGEKIVGTVKTLIFHLGHAPHGERTDWVIHEYKIIDTQLASIGLQDTYVLCKVFKKNGPGPKIGAQYGAPFNEEDWSDDDADGSEIQAASSNPIVQLPVASTPEKQSCVSLDSLAPEITSDTLLINECPNVKQSSAKSGLLHPGSTSGPSLVESSHPSAEPTASELPDQVSYDDIERLLAYFTDDPSLLENGDHEDTLTSMPQNMTVPCLDGYDIYSGLQNLNNTSAPMSQPISDMSGMPKVDDYAFYNMFMKDSSDYIELNDLEKPLNFPMVTFGTDQFYDMACSYNNNVPQFSFNGTDQPASCIDQPPMVSIQSNNGNSGLDVGQINQFVLGSNSLYDPLTSGQSSNGLDNNEYMSGCRR